ncbi:hypothetical protein SAMN05421505_111109 [Sinosporangium album]|uniref:Transcriptional regulator n=1 Tax=Sinosporangium album TaxID=504805 RepID=A0A1G7ZLW1_9ACTN|nr:hypothetical protein [Sinosporangium album]SDH09577.1 hypothetical protein SAMN05421505_111109 [Sinosporangium album]
MAPPANERLARNENLQLLMERAGWRPETLARKVNLVLAGTREKRRVHEKTPYRWLNRGEVPHAPVPDVVAYLLSRAIGEPVAFDQVWPPGTRPCATWAWADDGRDIPWDHQGLLQLLGEWSHTMLTRRRCLVLGGAALTGAAWQWLDAPAPIPALRGEGDQITPETLSLIDTIVAGAQSLDEKHGSGAADFVASQFNAVARLLRRSSYDAKTGQRLCTALGQLAQTSGWMAHEAARDGQAQRWFLTGLRAAHSAGDPALAAGIIALMSNQATTIGKSAEAIQLAAAAQEAARGCSRSVRAIVSARSCLAYADVGDSAGFHRSRDGAMELITRAAEEGEQPPGWASHVTPSEPAVGAAARHLAQPRPHPRRRPGRGRRSGPIRAAAAAVGDVGAVRGPTRRPPRRPGAARAAHHRSPRPGARHRTAPCLKLLQPPVQRLASA